MMTILFIMIGGGIGAALRHGLFVLVQGMSAGEFPAGTMAVNLTGSFFIGLLWGLLEKVHLSPEFRLFIFTGLLGGFTTFSSFTRETAQLIKIGQIKEAVFYLSASNILGVLLVFIGFISAQHLLLVFSK